MMMQLLDFIFPSFLRDYLSHFTKRILHKIKKSTSLFF